MKEVEVMYHLPDKTRMSTWIECCKIPKLGDIVELDGDDDGIVEKHRVVGLRIRTKWRFLWWEKEVVNIYLDDNSEQLAAICTYCKK